MRKILFVVIAIILIILAILFYPFQNRNFELNLACEQDIDCIAYTVTNRCEIYCAKEDESNQQVVKELEYSIPSCSVAHWNPPSVKCGCINKICQRVQ